MCACVCVCSRRYILTCSCVVEASGSLETLIVRSSLGFGSDNPALWKGRQCLYRDNEPELFGLFPVEAALILFSRC